MKAMQQTQAIEVSGASKTFNAHSRSPVHALKNVDLSVQRGEIVALLGTNGAGKTTLVDLILGLSRPTAGTVEVLNNSPKLAFYRQNIGALMQTGGLLHEMTVQDTVKMIAATFPRHLPLDDVVKQANLEPIYTRRVGKCSGGEQQRIRFALAILGNPDILILDEPTAGMDAGARSQFWQSMRRQSEQGRTIIFTTHYLKEAEEFAERIVLMHKGEIIADGTTYELQNMSSERIVTAEFPGEIPELADIPGVTANEIHGHHLRLVSQDSDALARYLLSETDARNLSITNPSLENMFLELTNQNQEI